jgi:signal transduction histidine kinase
MSHILQYGPQHLQIESVDLRKVWRDCVVASQPAIRDKSITLKEQITKEALVTVCDRQKIGYVFNSLLTHAIRATNNGGQVSVEFSLGRQHEITFRITDSGGGLPPEELNKVFERYYGSRLPVESKTESGLAGVYDIVGLHGGRLFVNSRTGEGSTFLFTLPAVRQDIEEKTADEQAVNSSRRRR